MLQIIEKMRDLNFRQLMEVYEEGNMENGDEMFPDAPESQRILLAEQAFYQYLNECFFTTLRAVYALWVEDGRYISALRLEPYQDGLLIEALETMPSFRNRGYAKALLTEVKKYAGHNKLYSHVSKKNRASLKTHEACGFYRILEHAIYADGSVFSTSCTFCSQDA